MDRGILLKEMASPQTRAGWWMINTKKCYQDAGFIEIRENDRAGWRVGEVPGKVCYSHGQDAKESGWCQRLRILSGENDQGQWSWRWKRRGLLRIFPPAASSWRPWPSLLGQGMMLSLNTPTPLPCASPHPTLLLSEINCLVSISLQPHPPFPWFSANKILRTTASLIITTYLSLGNRMFPGESHVGPQILIYSPLPSVLFR